MNTTKIETSATAEAGNSERQAESPEKLRLKGFGSVYQRGKSKIWHIRYSWRRKEYRESSHSERQADAIRLLKRRWKETGRGRFIGPSEDKVLIDDLLTTLEEDYALNRRRSTPSLKWRLRHLRAAFGGAKAIEVGEDAIDRYKTTRLAERTEVGNRPVRPATVNRELAALRKAFKLAVRQKRISTAPSVTMLPENNVRQGFVEPREFAAIVNSLPDYLRDFAQFAYLTGWRKGELQSLTWADVNRDAQRIILRRENSKNNEPRLLPLAGELAEIIERRWQARVIQNQDGSTTLAEFVFHRGDGKAIRDFRDPWAKACKAAGMAGLLFHDLRRSAVRNFDKAGVSQTLGMAISGHKTASIYRRYRITPEQDIREALEKTQAANAQAGERRVVPILKPKEVGR